MTTQQLPDRFRWPVAVEREFAVPATRVWQVISMPGNLEPCHPFCVKNPVEVWPGPDSRDEIFYLSGWVFQRHFFNWLDGVGYDLKIGRQGGRQSSVSWRIRPIDEQSAALKITVYPFVLQGVPVLIRWLPHLIRVRPLLHNYLDAVLRGFDWYITRNERVPRDQFGKHPWFSAAN